MLQNSKGSQHLLAVIGSSSRSWSANQVVPPHHSIAAETPQLSKLLST